MFWRRDRTISLTGAGLIAAAALAWVAVAGRAGAAEMGLTGSATLSVVGAVEFLVGWGVMMAAMMLPSAVPMIALYGAIHRGLAGKGDGAPPTALFALVYLMVWLLVGVPVYAAGLALMALAEASPAAAGLLPYGVAAVLVVAGLYQLSPLKRTCLHACRSPLSFLMARWRPGSLGALRTALAHAVYCVGCCWALMAVLVAAGAMGLHWVLLIAALVFAEKVLPAGETTARIGGAALILLGVLVMAQPTLAAILRGYQT